MTLKEEKFRKLAESRVRKALKMIKLVANLANRAHYDYTRGDAQKILKALQDEVSAARARFNSKNTRVDTDFKL